MAIELMCEIHPRLDAVNAHEWRQLFPGLPDSVEMIQLIQRCGIDGFTFHSIVVRWRERPILLLPLFETQYHLSTFVDPTVRPILDKVACWLPAVGYPRLLGVGFVEGEWGQVGVDASVPRDILAVAWDQALAALDALSVGLRADLTAFINFTATGGRMLPLDKLGGFTGLPGLPYGQVPITFRTMEEYIAKLSGNTRSSLRRKIRSSREVEMLRTRDPGPWIDTIFRFYLDTVRRSDVVFGVHQQAYFEQVCEAVPGAEYHLYFVKDQLLAFRLVVVTPGCLVDKYFGMDLVQSREHNLYFVSWYQNLLYCLEHGIPLYHSGQAEEDTKARLGARFLPSAILFRHRRPFLHRLLTLLGRHVAYEPKVRLPSIHLGTDWDATGVESDSLRSLGDRGAVPATNGHQQVQT